LLRVERLQVKAKHCCGGWGPRGGKDDRKQNTYIGPVGGRKEKKGYVVFLRVVISFLHKGVGEPMSRIFHHLDKFLYSRPS
jgi:hypothetical protein